MIVRRFASILLGLFFVVAGVNHFVHPSFYVRIVPNYLPAHALLVQISGILECLGGIGALIPSARRVAGIGLIALLVAVFPANLEMAQHPERYGDIGNAPLFSLRLPVQALLIAWVWWTCLSREGLSSAGDRARNRPRRGRVIGPMKIGIIGAGNIGSTLTRRFRQLGHQVSVANSRGPQSLADLARETGAKAVTPYEAAHGQDVVVVTIPEKNVPDLPADLFAGVPDDVVVIDTGNYYPRQRDGRIPGIEEAPSESRWVAQKLGRPVVKTFNNIYAQHLHDNGKPRGSAGRVALPIAGDDADAKRIVMELVDQLGFDPVDAGSIDDSWRQQPGSPVYTHDLDAAGVRDALARAQQQRTSEWTATERSPGDFNNPA